VVVSSLRRFGCLLRDMAFGGQRVGGVVVIVSFCVAGVFGHVVVVVWCWWKEVVVVVVMVRGAGVGVVT